MGYIHAALLFFLRCAPCSKMRGRPYIFIANTDRLANNFSWGLLFAPERAPRGGTISAFGLSRSVVPGDVRGLSCGAGRADIPLLGGLRARRDHLGRHVQPTHRLELPAPFRALLPVIKDCPLKPRSNLSSCSPPRWVGYGAPAAILRCKELFPGPSSLHPPPGPVVPLAQRALRPWGSSCGRPRGCSSTSWTPTWSSSPSAWPRAGLRVLRAWAAGKDVLSPKSRIMPDIVHTF